MCIRVCEHSCKLIPMKPSSPSHQIRTSVQLLTNCSIIPPKTQLNPFPFLSFPFPKQISSVPSRTKNKTFFFLFLLEIAVSSPSVYRVNYNTTYYSIQLIIIIIIIIIVRKKTHGKLLPPVFWAFLKNQIN